MCVRPGDEVGHIVMGNGDTLWLTGRAGREHDVGQAAPGARHRRSPAIGSLDILLGQGSPPLESFGDVPEPADPEHGSYPPLAETLLDEAGEVRVSDEPARLAHLEHPN